MVIVLVVAKMRREGGHRDTERAREHGVALNTQGCVPIGNSKACIRSVVLAFLFSVWVFAREWAGNGQCVYGVGNGGGGSHSVFVIFCPFLG